MCHHKDNPIDSRPVWENPSRTMCNVAKYRAWVAEQVFTILDEIRASGL